MPLLGAPGDPLGWQHGSAGSVRDERRIDCWLRLEDGRIAEARLEVFGPGAAIAAAEWLANWLIGRPVAEVEALSGREIARRAGVADEARGDALCMEDAMRAALAAPPGEGG